MAPFPRYKKRRWTIFVTQKIGTCWRSAMVSTNETVSESGGTTMCWRHWVNLDQETPCRPVIKLCRVKNYL